MTATSGADRGPICAHPTGMTCRCRLASGADRPTPAEIRAWVDAVEERSNPDGSINAQHVAMEQGFRQQHGHRNYIAELDGPGKFIRGDLAGDYQKE